MATVKIRTDIAIPPELVPDVSHLETENDEPVDNIFSEKQQRLLVSALYQSWKPIHPKTGQERIFLAAENVGIYSSIHTPPLVPDVFISLDVAPPTEWWEKHNRCYMIWEFGKTPELALEIVSNLVGGELSGKMEKYAEMRVSNYIVFDPSAQYGSQKIVRMYEWLNGEYLEQETLFCKQTGLGVTLWEGEFEGGFAQWLRWCDHDGNLIPLPSERVAEAEDKAREAEDKARELELLLSSEKAKNETLARKLRELGINL